MRIHTKLTLIGVSIILLTSVLMIFTGVWQSNQFGVEAQNKADKLVNQDLLHITDGAYDLVQSQDYTISERVKYGFSIAHYLLNKYGGVKLDNSTCTWEAVNQFTKQKTRVNTRKVLINNVWLGQNTDINTETPLVDTVKDLSGVSVTVFQKMNDSGDMLRVATNVQTLTSKRAISTYIPSTNPDGSPNKVVSSILAGKIYRGNAYVVNAWYVTEYEPIFDSKHRIIGALFAGMKQESEPALRNSIQNIRVGNTGNVSIILGDGKEQGTYLISRNGTLDGKNMWDATDAAGSLYIQNIINTAKTLHDGASQSIRYLKVNDNGVKTWHIAQISYYRPWNWVIVADTCESDFQEIKTGLTKAKNNVIQSLLIIGLLSAIFAYWIIQRFAGNMSNQLIHMMNSAKKIANGEINEVEISKSGATAFNNRNGDEITELEYIFTDAVVYINEISSVAMSMADGNLTGNVTPKSDHDVLGNAFARLVYQLRNIIAQLIMVANTLSISSKTLNESAETSTDSSNMTVTSMNEIALACGQSAKGASEVARGAMDQAAKVTQTSELLHKLSYAISSIKESSDLSSSLANEADNAATDGGIVVDQTILGMEQIHRTVQESANVINELRQSSSRIGSIIQTIDEIADQTNLLALNAAIEAARAGDAGKGFAVVAEEVRKLAERSSNATREIAVLINEVQDRTDKAVSSMALGAGDVENGMKLAKKAGDSLKHIQVLTNSVRDQIIQIKSASEDVEIATRETSDTIESVAALIEQTSASAEQVSASSEQVAASVQVVTDISSSELSNSSLVSASAKDIEKIVDNLNQLVSIFDIDGYSQSVENKKAA